MTQLQIALTIILGVIGFILILLIIFQSGRVKNLGSSIVGTQNVELFNIKKRGFDKILHIITFGLVILFIGIAFTLFFLSGGNN